MPVNPSQIANLITEDPDIINEMYGFGDEDQERIDYEAYGIRESLKNYLASGDLSQPWGQLKERLKIGGKYDLTEWRGDPSEPKLARYFGGEPVDLGGDDPDDPQSPIPPSDTWTVRGVTELVDPAGVVRQRYITVPEPRA